WEELAREHGDERCPVFGVPVEDCYRFAVWLGGHLPTRQQWDKAAGFYDGYDFDQQGPYEEPWEPGEIAVGRSAPMAVGTALKDRSRFGVRDMAGNGREWTRDVSGNLQVPLQDPRPHDRVLLRGAGYQFGQPLRFGSLKPSQPDDSAPYIPNPKEG